MIQAQPFWHFDIGNVLTWGIVACAWIIARLVDARTAAEDIKELKRWRALHETESDSRDKLLLEMEKTNIKLATLADIAEKRLERLENVAHSMKCPLQNEP
jgi:hypothetical protein